MIRVLTARGNLLLFASIETSTRHVLFIYFSSCQIAVYVWQYWKLNMNVTWSVVILKIIRLLNVFLKSNISKFMYGMTRYKQVMRERISEWADVTDGEQASRRGVDASWWYILMTDWGSGSPRALKASGRNQNWMRLKGNGGWRSHMSGWGKRRRNYKRERATVNCPVQMSICGSVSGKAETGFMNGFMESMLTKTWVGVVCQSR